MKVAPQPSGVDAPLLPQVKRLAELLARRAARAEYAAEQARLGSGEPAAPK